MCKGSVQYQEAMKPLGGIFLVQFKLVFAKSEAVAHVSIQYLKNPEWTAKLRNDNGNSNAHSPPVTIS